MTLIHNPPTPQFIDNTKPYIMHNKTRISTAAVAYPTNKGNISLAT